MPQRDGPEKNQNLNWVNIVFGIYMPVIKLELGYSFKETRWEEGVVVKLWCPEAACN